MVSFPSRLRLYKAHSCRLKVDSLVPKLSERKVCAFAQDLIFRRHQSGIVVFGHRVLLWSTLYQMLFCFSRIVDVLFESPVAVWSRWSCSIPRRIAVSPTS